jgi:hypothetical protein
MQRLSSTSTLDAIARRARTGAMGWAMALGLRVAAPGEALAAAPEDDAPPHADEPGSGELAPSAGGSPEHDPDPPEPGAPLEPAGGSADAGSPPPGAAAPEATAAPTDPAAPAAADDPSPALPSGQAKTDDVPVDETQQQADRRAGRRRRGRDRDEGQWQVFAPYPELGPIRYRDPESGRTLWLGVDAVGTLLPSSLGLADRAVWVVRPAGAWALALTPWLAVGGRHDVAWYDADGPRLRVHGHQVELSSRPLAASRSTDALDDRLALGLTTHAVRWGEGTADDPAGQADTIVHLGYGLDHLLGTRWRLGWQAQVRHAWVPHDTQRQVRLSARVAFNPRPAHRLSLDAVGYYVNRDHPSGDEPLPHHSVLGQVGLGYAWVGRAGVGPWTHVRATSRFASGEAPVYEPREESLDGAYGEVLVGMLARWP